MSEHDAPATVSGEPSCEVHLTLVDRLGFSAELAGALADAAAREDRRVQVEDGDPETERAVQLGLVVRAGGSTSLSAWCASFLNGSTEVSDEVFAWSVPVPSLQDEVCDQVLRLLLEQSSVVEVVAPRGSTAAASAAGAVQALGLRPCLVDLRHLSAADACARVLPQVCLEARLLGLGLLLLLPHDSSSDQTWQFLRAQAWPAVAFVERRTRSSTPRAPFATVEVGDAVPAGRRACWDQMLRPGLDPEGLDRLAALPLSLPEMHEVFVRATSRAVASGVPLSAAHLVEQGRALLAEAVSRLAVLREPRTQLDDLVLDTPARAALERFLAAAASSLGLPAERRRGVRALFSGPSGTGKTATAEALGTELGRPVFFVEVSRVVDKYIGETEKNLDRVLGEAQRSGALLVFDEGEALFSSRNHGGGTSAHFSNMQTSYLLARLEQHSGVVVVASNYPGAIDAAFQRRFHFSLVFRPPDAAVLPRLWSRLLRRHGLDESLDVTPFLHLELTAGVLDNAVYLASLLHGATDQTLSDLLLDLLRTQYAGLGKRWPGDATA